MPGRISIILFTLYLTPLFICAQATTEIAGKILDEEGAPVIGANVFLLDSYDGATTGEEGLFTFGTTLTGAQTLVVSYLGYQEQRVPVVLEGRRLEQVVALSSGSFELESVLITAGAFGASGENRSEVLKPLDIVTTAGATADLAGVFNTLPGTQAVGEEGRLFVRGGESYESKTFIDGMQVGNFYSPAAPNTPSRSRFLPFMFSGASFSTGGYSAEFGQALSSALILQSKPVATQDRLDISLMSVGGDVGFTKAWESSSLSGKLQYTNIDPYFALINQEIDWIDPPTSYEGSLAYRKNVGESGILKLYGVGNYSSFSLHQYTIDQPQAPLPTEIRNGYGYLNAVLHDQLDHGWTLKTGASLTVNQDWLGVAQNDVDQLDVDLHAKVVMDKDLTDLFHVRFGSEYFLTTVRQDFADPDPALSASRSYASHRPALFAETDLRLTTKLLARVGLRSSYGALSDRLQAAPRLSLAYKTGAHSQVSAAFGRFRQAPVSRFLLEEPRLRDEAATHYILNYQVGKEDRIFRIEAYHKEYDRLVRYEAHGNGRPTGIAGNGTGYARGIDLFWRDSRTIRGGDYWLSYSYLDTRRFYRDFPHAATPGFASRHNFSAVYKHFITPLKSQLGATFRYAGGRPYHDPNRDGFQNRSTKDYIDLSLNISYLINQQTILHASATNVLGRDHIFGYEFASAPNEEGTFESRAIRPPARRFLFVGLFITLSKENTFNQLPNL